MRIAVCEDDLACMRKLKCLFDQSIGYRANYFTTGKEFLQKLEENAYYDIILLDIRLPDILGTKIACWLKQKLPGADVVFLSSFPEYVTEAFTLQVSQFLLKPLNEQLLMGELDRIVRRRKEENAIWCVNGHDAVYRLMTRDIIYVESYYRHLGIQMKEQRLEISGKIADARKALNPNIFYLCHQGFLVNMNYITKIEQKELICTPDFRVPISSRRRSDFMKAYSEFLGK
ncbi:DNA-binding response regulator [Clostridiaceae bacterium]|nr:DNA-binding response regulator [Clostridiaceae bacterium]